MFITLSYSTHLIISIFLHVLGVMIGLFVWYLFPKNPSRYITKLPNEISLLVENVDEEAVHEKVAKATEARMQPAQRYFG